jgi:Fic family protein
MATVMDIPSDPLASLKLTPALVRLVAEIDEFKGRWQALGALAPDRLSALRRVATIESVASSTRIEGSQLSDAEVDALLAGLDVRSFRSRDEQEVAGYAAAMQLVFDGWRDMAITENLLKHLHQVLLRHAVKDQRHRGEYKKLANDVKAFDAEGDVIGVVFQTASPFETPMRMEQLVRWTADALEARAHHPLLVIATFVVAFLAIHPFQDGNGRLSRIMTTLLLLRAGYDYVPYSSLERVVEENKDAYYLALRHAQSEMHGDHSKLHEWVDFFLRALQRQKDHLATRIERERTMHALPELSERILRIAREHRGVTVRAVVAATNANRNTVKAHVQKLVAAGLLVRRGERKGAWYEPA